jgi:hypothetical protein
MKKVIFESNVKLLQAEKGDIAKKAITQNI